MYTPNLGLGIAVFDREREQGRFGGSTGGAGGRKEPVLAPRTAARLSLLLPRLRVSSILCDQRELLKNEII